MTTGTVACFCVAAVFGGFTVYQELRDLDGGRGTYQETCACTSFAATSSIKVNKESLRTNVFNVTSSFLAARQVRRAPGKYYT
jgi:hypothetical protein